MSGLDRTAMRASGVMTVITLTAALTMPAQASSATGWHVTFEDQYGSTTNYSAYYSVVAPGSDDAWAFGTTNAAAAPSPVAVQYTGSSWQQVTLPSGLAGSSVEAASASSASNIWAVTDGNELAALDWNGSDWSVAHTWDDPGAEITGVTALSQKDVWVFGAGGYTGGIGTWHFNGSTWTEVSGNAAGIAKASAVSAKNIWAVGSNGTAPQNRIVQYIKGTWHRVSSPVLGTSSQFQDVLALCAKDVWVDGEAAGGQPPAVLAHFNGKTWTRVTVPWKVTLNAIASDGAGGLWLTAQPASSSATWLLHRSQSGTWTKTVIGPAGSAVFDLTLVNGTTAMLGAGEVATADGSAAAVYQDGTLGS